VTILFASMAQVIGEKEGRYMKTKIKYTEEPMGDLKIVKDFLPPPDQLVLREDNVKVTISLKKSSITFFKEQAKKQKTSYQKMIREVVDWYASHYQKSA
jgi:predicted DNA binding CopG/RHH family protein